MEYKQNWDPAVLEEFKYGGLYWGTARFINSIHSLAMLKKTGKIEEINKLQVDIKTLDHTHRFIPRPNNDTKYGFLVFDIKNGPIIIELPKVFPKEVIKHMSLNITSAGHHTNEPLGTRLDKVTGKVALVWKGNENVEIPADAEKIVIESTTGLALFRSANDPKIEGSEAEMIQWLNEIKIDAPEARPFEELFPFELEESNFALYSELEKILKYTQEEFVIEPNKGTDAMFLKSLKDYGIVYEDGNIDVSSVDLKEFIAEGPAIFKKFMVEALTPGTQTMAWFLERIYVTKEVAVDKDSYDKLDPNAINGSAIVGPLALNSTTTVYATMVKDSEGETLTSGNDYVVTLNGEMYENIVKGFWSTTLYESSNGFFFVNDTWLYATGSLVGLKKNEDGNYEIYVGPTKPEGVQKEAWLSTGGDTRNVPIDILFRFYEPDPKLIVEGTLLNRDKYLTIKKVS